MQEIGDEYGGKVIRMKGIVDMEYNFKELTVDNLEELIKILYEGVNSWNI